MIEFDSPEERYFADWLIELEKSGYVNSWERTTQAIPLTKGLKHQYIQTVILKTKTKRIPKSQTLLIPSEYTPDFGITWADKAKNVFFQPIYDEQKLTCPIIADLKDGEYYSIIEIKPVFDLHNMTRGFINNQKYIWDKYGAYVNLLVVPDIFLDTFSPATFFKTPTGLDKKFAKGKPLTLQQFNDKI
jgi:hypothetical protein